MKKPKLLPLTEEIISRYKQAHRPVLWCETSEGTYLSMCDRIETESKNGVVIALYLHRSWLVPVKRDPENKEWTIISGKIMEETSVLKCDNPRVMANGRSLVCFSLPDISIELSLHVEEVFQAEKLKRDHQRKYPPKKS